MKQVFVILLLFFGASTASAVPSASTPASASTTSTAPVPFCTSEQFALISEVGVESQEQLASAYDECKKSPVNADQCNQQATAACAKAKLYQNALLVCSLAGAPGELQALILLVIQANAVAAAPGANQMPGQCLASYGYTL